MAGLPIEMIDFNQSGSDIFKNAVNIRYNVLNWHRADDSVVYERSEINSDFPGYTSVFIRVDKYPGLANDHPLVVSKGRDFVMPLVFANDALEFPPTQI